MPIRNGLLRLTLLPLIGIMPLNSSDAVETQITHAQHGHILTNTGCWSPDSQWVVFDVRSDPAGDAFDSTRIERVHVRTGDVEKLFQSRAGAKCGVATYCPTSERVVFICGPQHPDEHWQYAADHRRGLIVATDRPGITINLDARDIDPPFTPGALRGGTHVHTFSGDGRWVAFTYEDHVLHRRRDSERGDKNQRNVGVSVSGRPIDVPNSHRRNHGGTHFSALVTRTVNAPKPGSDQISRAFSDAWVGTNGYRREDGSRQPRAIAFQGLVSTRAGETISEVFLVDLPEDVTHPGPHGPLQGTIDRRPSPPQGTLQRRLTFTADRKYPGIQGIRHWLRSCPDGSQIAFLMRDDDGVSQLWTILPSGGEPRQITTNRHDVASAFSWSPDGKRIAHAMDGSICLTHVATGITTRLTKPDPESPIRPEACVISPDGSLVAYLREVTDDGQRWNQIFTLPIPAPTGAGQ